jgi:hypothetical protein
MARCIFMCADVPLLAPELLHGFSSSNYLFMAVQPSVGPWRLLQFLDLYTVGKTP